MFIFIFGSSFSQDLEESIYVATETFNANPNTSTFLALAKKEANFKTSLKTKDEYFAYLDLLVNKGYYLFKNNKQTQAIITYENAWNIYNTQIEGVFKYDITENCLKRLSTLYNRIGDYTNAENTIKQYIFLAEKERNNPHRISGAINLSQLYFTIGKFQSAIEVVENGLKIKYINTTHKQKLERIKSNSQIASSKQSYIKDTLVLSTKTDNETRYQLALKNKNYKKALSLFYLKYLHIDKETLTARTQAKLNIEEAQIYYKLNDLENTSKKLFDVLKNLLPTFNTKGLPEKEDLYAENTFIDVFDLLAELQPNTNNILACYDLSFYVSQLLQSNITSQEGKLIHLEANRKRSEACINLLFEAYQTKKDSSLIIKAFSYAEKNKVSILKETIGKKLALDLYPNDSLLIKEQALLQKQERITNDLIKAQYQKNASDLDRLSKASTQTSITLKQLKKEIDIKYPKEKTSSISIKKIQDKLDQDNAILIEYFYGKNAVFKFTIVSTSIGFTKIERDESFDSIIANYIDYFNNSSIINNDIPKFTEDAFNLYNLLGFVNTSSYKNVVVIPDGFLNFVPFESLLSTKTTTKNYSKMPFVATQQQLAYNASALFYINNKPFVFSDTVLGIFPVFENTNAKLTYSLDEAESIEKQVDAKFLMYTDATKKDALEQANNYGVLHLSTHASSGTFLMPANIDFVDDKLFLNELYSLNLNTNLVVLSACETGIGKLNKGEGSMSLARGFQYAGIENLIFSLWKINDLSTSQLMTYFYKNYSANQSAFVANHKAKVAYLKDKAISNTKKSPYYWSAFVYYGDLSPEKTSSYSNYVGFAFIGLAIPLLLWIIIRRRKNGRNA